MRLFFGSALIFLGSKPGMINKLYIQSITDLRLVWFLILLGPEQYCLVLLSELLWFGFSFETSLCELNSRKIMELTIENQTTYSHIPSIFSGLEFRLLQCHNLKKRQSLDV